MSIILRPFQYVYFSANETEVLFYNLYNKEIYRSFISSEKYVIKGGNIILEEITNDNSPLVELFQEKNVGYFIDSINNEILLFDHYDYLRNYYIELIDKNSTFYSNIREYIHQITIHLDSFWELYTWKVNGLNNISEIELSALESFISYYAFPKLQKVQLVVGENYSYYKLQNILDLFSFIPEIELICPVIIVNQLGYIKKKYKSISFIILLNRENINDSLIKSLQHECSYKFVIQGDLDISSFDTLSEASQDLIEISFSPCANNLFLRKNLSYSINDLCKTLPIDIKSLIKNEIINIINWGKIAIYADGDIYSGPFAKIGTLKEIDFSIIANREISPWFKTRNNFHLCKNCNMNCLCPPLSIFEISHNQVFCHER